ncbi:hypothetical protein JCGZ_15219 [Jatropha curcas]|uniref:Aminotransferase-like plant mobile domain-containing protein n=1 Tax=Jatropha curcas TaxID=180498 RepID=A0A067K9H5_JATCU|nr:hypothetical protein JCGZ_15219 [Jatropha curcas]
MRGFQSEVDLGKARAGGSSTDASAFWDLLDPPMRSRVVAAGFGDYATGLRWTQPRFQPAMRYALMEWWNDCTHSFIFDFGEITLTPADYTTITGLGFDGDAARLDSRYQTAALGAELVRTLLSVTTHTRYTMHGYVSYEIVYKLWAERIRTRLATWRELLVDARPATLAYTREERDQAARSFIFYIVSSQLICTSQNKGDHAVLACLRDLSLIGSYDWASLGLAHLYHGLDVWTRGSGESNWQFLRPLEVWANEYRIYPGSPESDTSTEAWRIPRYLAHRHHTFSSSEDPYFWRRYLNDRALTDLLLTPWDGDAWAAYPPRALAEALTRSRVLLQGYWVDRLLEYDGFPADAYLVPGDYASYLSTRLRTRLPDVREYTQVPAQRYQELYQRFYFARSYIARICPELHERELEIGRLRRHQSCQASAVARLQMEVDQLRTRLEVEGIPLDFSEEEEDDDDDGSSSEYALPPPPSFARQAAVGPSRRRRAPSHRFHDDHGRDHVLTVVRDIALQVTNFNVHHRGCSMLLQAWALDKLSLIPPVPARSIATYGPANFRPRSRGQFDFGDNPVIRWTCPWWRIRLGSMNLSYVLYASLDRSMAYLPDRINRQYSVVQRVPRAHNFESGPMTPSLLTNLADRWRNRNIWYLGQGVMQDTVTSEYIDWFYSQ